MIYMTKFKVINPVIHGTFESEYEGDTAIQAVKKFWDALTSEQKLITNNIPEFYCTFLNLDDGKSTLYHFKIIEKPDVSSSSHADITIEEMTVNLSDQEKKDFIAQVDKVEKRIDAIQTGEHVSKENQSGGKKKKPVKKTTKKVSKKNSKKGKLVGGSKHRKRYNDDDSSTSSCSSSSSDSSDSSDDELDYLSSLRLKKMKQPIVYWWYTPTLYKVPNVFTPTFVSPLHPYVQLWIR